MVPFELSKPFQLVFEGLNDGVAHRERERWHWNSSYEPLEEV